MKDKNVYNRFNRLTFEDFKSLAQNSNLTPQEKIGFPENYRKEYEKDIFKDILYKLPELEEKNKFVLDIGCGCSGLAFLVLELCEKKGHNLIVLDSEEMLSHLPEKEFIFKFPYKFPDCPELFVNYKEKIDIIIVYSVLQHVFLEDSIYRFIDKSLELLPNGGKLLLGDIPNISKRKRYFSSPKGIKMHQEFTSTQEIPDVKFLNIEYEKIDDSVIFSILQRYRGFGFETYLLPQSLKLPMSNRREDILIIKP